MAKKKDEITIRSSAAEYLTYVASVGDQQDSMRQPLTMIKILQRREDFMRPFRIKCIMPFMDIRRLN